MPQLIYFFPLAGSEDLTVEIYPEGGGAIVNTGGDAFTDSAAPDGRYAATVAEAMSGKKHVRILFDGTAIEDFIYNFSGAGPHILNNPPVDADVRSLSSSVVTQLGGLAITFTDPVYNTNGFSRPLVRGDSYTGPKVLTIRVAGWSGPDLDTADEITLTAKKHPQNTPTFAWTQTDGQISVAADDDDWIITLDLDPTDTDQTAGLYNFDIEFEFAGGIKHTVIGPGSTLRIVQDQTT